MQAIILLGGKGTRLQGLYPDRPKALVPVAGRPFLQWQVEWLERHGIRDIHLAAGHKASAIRDWVTSTSRSGAMTVSVEPAPLGTGGGLAFAGPFIRSDPFLILNGDSLLPNLDIQSLARSVHPSDILVTLAVTRIKETGRYGTVEFDARNRVTAFREKAERVGGWINGGVYLARRTLLPRIKPPVPVGQQPAKSDAMISLETDVFPAVCAAGQMDVAVADPPLLDMGTPDGLHTMETYLRKLTKPGA